MTCVGKGVGKKAALALGSAIAEKILQDKDFQSTAGRGRNIVRA